MKIKTKLTLGVGLLFILIILLSLVGAFNINALKSDTENILRANYNSLLYSRNILAVLNNPSDKSFEQIELNLRQQEKNATEIGENEANLELRKNIEAYQNKTSDSHAQLAIQQSLYQIMNLNMQAIQRKSEIANATADKAVLWIAITGSLCFIIAFTLLINLPANIANPIKELTESIKQIATGNYAERVHFESHGEFGQLAQSFNTMAEKLEEYNSSNLAKLMMEKKRIETLINNMHDPVIGLDENLKIIFANEEAIKITGMNKESLLGHYTKDLAIKNDLIRTLIQDLMFAPSEEKAKPIKIFSDNKEGYFEKETLHISVTPTGEQKQKLIGHVLILRNITEYKELDFAKTNFIATVSHEFKTPISSIKMSLQLLENEQIGKLNIEQKNLVDSIKDDASRLLNITSELLNMTQVESGNIQLSILPADSKEILLCAIHATQTQADQRQITFDIDCPEHISKVQADNEKTAWVLTNLISNAIRYSYENSTIYLTIKELNNKIQISVRDTGQGIAPQYKDKIFDRYFRVPGTKKEGTGLGLAISKEFIEAQGGHISVESEFGSGSTFSVTLNKLT
ncbi:MAG: HAMP domain-containing protein [Cyclobacteriaceae bacterium]|jgi:two-component system, NtrC family, sensor histidine kinase KinB|nr:HAMP domain-containing protein [Cyclobacteriaceae bacterium]